MAVSTTTALVLLLLIPRCTFPISPPIAACDQVAVFRLLFFIEQLHNLVCYVESQCVNPCAHLSPHVAHIGLIRIQDRIDRGPLSRRQTERLLQVIGITPVLTVSLLGTLASGWTGGFAIHQHVLRRSADGNACCEYGEQQGYCP